MIRSLKLGENLDFNGALYVRVRSFLDSYGDQYDFARFWVQYEGGKQKSLLFLMDGFLTVLCKINADDELLAFISALDVKNVLSNTPLNFQNGSEISVFEKKGTVEQVSPQQFDYKEVYDRLSSAFSMPPFESWYVDLCHRVRHGGAAVLVDEYTVACAALGNSEALITGICVDTKYRRMGYGERAIKRLLAVSRCNKLYAMCDSPENDRFYTSCGFVRTGKIFQYIMGE